MYSSTTHNPPLLWLYNDMSLSAGLASQADLEIREFSNVGRCLVSLSNRNLTEVLIIFCHKKNQQMKVVLLPPTDPADIDL